MANEKKINFKAGFEVDKTGLNSLRKDLQDLKNISSSKLLDLNKSLNVSEANMEASKLRATARDIESALEKSFNKKLGTTNIKTFREELNKIGIEKINKQLSSLGPTGQSTFRKITGELLEMNVQTKKSSKLLDEMAQTMKNTVKWGISAKIIDTFTNKISEA